MRQEVAGVRCQMSVITAGRRSDAASELRIIGRADFLHGQRQVVHAWEVATRFPIPGP